MQSVTMVMRNTLDAVLVPQMSFKSKHSSTVVADIKSVSAIPSNISSSMLIPPLYAPLPQEANMHVSLGSHCRAQLRLY